MKTIHKSRFPGVTDLTHWRGTRSEYPLILLRCDVYSNIHLIFVFIWAHFTSHSFPPVFCVHLAAFFELKNLKNEMLLLRSFHIYAGPNIFLFHLATLA